MVADEPERTVMEMTLSEGKNRQIRRMCEAVGLDVARLRRTAVGPVKLACWRPANSASWTSRKCAPCAPGPEGKARRR